MKEKNKTIGSKANYKKNLEAYKKAMTYLYNKEVEDARRIADYVKSLQLNK